MTSADAEKEIINKAGEIQGMLNRLTLMAVRHDIEVSIIEVECREVSSKIDRKAYRVRAIKRIL